MNLNLNISGETFAEAERYLQQQMPAEEKLDFEGRMQADAQLRDAVDQVQLLIMGVKEAALSDSLNRFHRDMPSSPIRVVNVPRSNTLRRWLIAASLLFLVALGSWWMLGRPGKKEHLYSTYFKPDPGLITAMGSTDNYTFEKAMVDYKTGNYPAAIEAWTGLLKARPNSDTLQYFVGAAMLANHQEENSLVYFQKVMLAKQSAFRADAYWYAGLALVRSNRYREAALFLRQSGRPEAAALLRQLEQK